jgi:hypothetical protein
MIVQKLQPGLPRVRKSRARAALECLAFATFLCYWLWVTIGPNHTDDPLWMRALLASLPLLLARYMLGRLKVAMRGDSFLFDAQRKTIERNHQMIASFDDIERVQIRTYPDPDGGDRHRLSLVFRNGEKTVLDEHGNWEQILGAAYAVARILGVEVSKKGDRTKRYPLTISFGS